jgi:hypothetical protein
MIDFVAFAVIIIVVAAAGGIVYQELQKRSRK